MMSTRQQEKGGLSEFMDGVKQYNRILKILIAENFWCIFVKTTKELK